MTAPVTAAAAGSPPVVPGLRFAAARLPAEPSPLRSDVAGFVGRTRRGPVGAACRVEGWRGYQRLFGPLDASADTTYALRGYFENGGEVAWVVRLCGDDPRRGAAGRPAAADARWDVGPVAAPGGVLTWGDGAPVAGGFPAASFRVVATSPGEWANGTTITIHYWSAGPADAPALDFAIQAPGEPPEYVTGFPPDLLHHPDAFPSAYVRLEALGPTPVHAAAASAGPRALVWNLRLTQGVAPAPARSEYVAGAQALLDVPEVAIVAAPDLARDLADADRLDLLAELLAGAARLGDRLVLVDLPDAAEGVPALARRVLAVRTAIDVGGAAAPLAAGAYPLRAAAVYHPWLRVDDPLAPPGTRLRAVPPSGHVAGVMSRLDRERGAYYTPANAELFDAVDTSRAFDAPEQGALVEAGVNLLRCAPGRGLLVWGGRTLEPEVAGRYVAHRRLVHRLVRAIRRVAEPLVFDVNGPTLWLALVRAITTVLLAAWRGGGLKGTRPEEAFAVHCDETTNPPEARDLGRVLCIVEIAPAVPMEFIELRIALSADGRLEVFES